AREQGLIVLRGNCFEDAEMGPYGPFVDVLRDLIGQWPSAVELMDRQQVRLTLSALAPELGRSGQGDDLSSYSESERRQRLFDAYGRLLVQISAQTPLVLIVDDLHWADEPSALLLRHLTRTLRQSPAVVLCAYRDSDLEQGDPFERVLIDLTREHLARRLTLRRLDTDATAEIVARVLESRTDRLSPNAVESIQRESEGVPFFVEELSLHLREEGLLRQNSSRLWDLAPDADSLVPQSVRGVISRRLARLTPATRELLALASIFGREFGLNVLVDIAGRRGIADSQMVEDALEEAVLRRLLFQRDVAFVFAHEQIREVLYQGLSAIRRRQLHQLTAEAIERYHPDDARIASRLAFHFSHGDNLERALRFTILAAEEATRVHALNDAARMYANALEILDLIDDPKDRLQRFNVLVARDSILAAGGEHAERSDGVDAMLDISAWLERQLRVTALVRASDYSSRVQDRRLAVEQSRKAVDLARPLPTPDRLTALLALGQALTNRPMGEPSLLFRDPEHLSASADVFRDAYGLATELGDRQSQARIAQELGVIEWAMQESSQEESADSSRGWLLRALEGFRVVGDRKGEVTSLIALAYRRSVVSSTSTTDARDSYVSFLEEIRRLRATEHRLTRVSERSRMEALALLSIDLYCRTNGWYEVALQRAGQALVWAIEARDTRVTVMALLGLSESERTFGRPTRAIEYAERALAALDSHAGSQPAFEHQRDAVQRALAASYAMSGNLDRALEAARIGVERASSAGPTARLAEALTGLAEVAESAGASDLARDSAHEALRVAAGMAGNIIWDIRGELVLARLALAIGDANLALGHAAAAVGRLSQRDVPTVWLRIGVNLTRGQALLAAGFDDDGREALAIAHALVMTTAERISDPALRSTYLTRSPLAREVVAAAERIGLTSNRSAGGAANGAPDVLTRREVEVLRLVADGRPNREIADLLFISEKTVARHLTHIFTKLDVESRTQAAAWAYRQGVA
ncbi:MAG: LuxR C-terminal-related transcriptional regulator, partial [Thermomicrobiales bacterium]